MSCSMRAAGSAATDFAVRATRNRLADAAAVTASFVCADSIVAMRTWKASSFLFLEIFSTAGSSMPWIALPSLRMTTWTEETGATATCYLLPDGRQRVFTGKYGEDVPDGELRHRGAGFACGAAQVRPEQDVLVFEQPRMDNGFAFVDVERGAGDQTLVERPGQRFFIHDR